LKKKNSLSDEDVEEHASYCEDDEN